MRFALIKNGIVDNVIESHDTPPGWVPCGAAAPGWSHFAGVFTPPPAPPAPRRITPLAFRRRFTKPERAAIEWAAVDRAELPPEQRMQSAALRADLKDQAQATFIDLDDADVLEGVQTLEQVGLLPPGRAAEIIGSPVLPNELLTF